MKIKTIAVGGSFPGDVAYSGINMEVVAEVSPDEDIQEVTSELKVQVAKLVSGGSSFSMENALRVLKYPDLQEVRADLIAELNELEAEIAQLENKVTSGKALLNSLAGLSGQLSEIEDVCEFYGIASEFWKIAAAIMAKRGDRKPTSSAATETGDDADDADPVPY
ncbi:MAG: hypothetical protein F6K48_27480 [Okeania sp. SIO3H1]|nr:hypothetical protein [Okeania sp. SIO3H1]